MEEEHRRAPGNVSQIKEEIYNFYILALLVLHTFFSPFALIPSFHTFSFCPFALNIVRFQVFLSRPRCFTRID